MFWHYHATKLQYERDKNSIPWIEHDTIQSWAPISQTERLISNYFDWSSSRNIALKNYTKKLYFLSLSSLIEFHIKQDRQKYKIETKLRINHQKSAKLRMPICKNREIWRCSLPDIPVVPFLARDRSAPAQSPSNETFVQHLQSIVYCLCLFVQSHGTELWKLAELVEEADCCSSSTCTIPRRLGSKSHIIGRSDNTTQTTKH